MLATATEPDIPVGNGIWTLKVAFVVEPLRSTGGRGRFCTRASLSAGPVRTTVTGAITTPVTWKPAGGGCTGGVSTRATDLLVVPVRASICKLTFKVSRLERGTVCRNLAGSRVALPCWRVTGHVRTSYVLLEMGLGNTATAFRFTSQLAGPLKCTTHGVAGGVGHNASAFVTSQSAAAWSTTCTVSVDTLRRSMLTTKDGGFWTGSTPFTSDLATTLSWTNGPGFALVASTTATMLSGFVVAIRSASPLTVTVVVVGGLINTRSGPTW